MTEPARIEVHIADGVADVRLNRAEKRNALDRAMFDALEATGAQLLAAPGVRAVVLSGNGPAFCAGLDMDSFRAMAAGINVAPDVTARTHGIANREQYVVQLWRDLPMPVIAAVHGIAFGGGFQLLLGADIRVVAPTTRLAVLEVQWGLVPDMGGIGLMRTLARDDVVRDLALTGRPFDGTQALQYGFATHLAQDPHATAMALARDIAGLSPDATRGIKSLLNMAAEASAAALLLAEAQVQERLLGSANQVEAVTARLAKRTADFIDP